MSTDGDSCKPTATVVNAGRQPEAETLVGKESQSSKINKINKTYKTFTDSLSEGEREDFLKFGEQIAKQLPKPPRLLKKWIAANWEDLSDHWYKSKGQNPPAYSARWETDPRTPNWLAIIEETANPLEFATDKEKQDFIRWCNETKQFSWLREGES
ncbi:MULTISPECIES: hypothetical protein [Nostoc]|uniref:Uncharacterized protein n=1 Tax=Nostoc paludosum FACHB-159 TaxID=2692908 RepID=A0ABR8KMX2_9NOSO|nr:MULTISPECIES: hypothetical protein [Nostoc]MBD2682890.1 hypothetical protein [Nostoc sp. FACHB-857]MBD2739227.1 hypothetical protein [Nostoc paludosum FACHB-159]